MAAMENGSLSWKRPPGPAKVWKRFEINEKTGSGRKDGKSLRFLIEEIPPERYDEVLDLMVDNYLPDEPLCRYFNIKDDSDGIEDQRNFWRGALNQGICVGLFLDEPQVDKREIAGVNLTLVVTRKDKESSSEFKSKSVNAGTIINFINATCADANTLDHYKVDKYLSAYGLMVVSRFRGYSLGGHLLGVRNDIGREYKIPITETAFTAPAAQRLAQRNGFEVLVEKKYSEAYDNQGQPLFPNINYDSVKIMGKHLY